MATRYYLPSSGTAGVSPTINSDWTNDDRGGAVSRPLVTSKSNTALTDLAGNSFVGNSCLFQYVSPQIGIVNFNTTTVSLVVRCLKVGSQSILFRANIRLYHPDTTFTTILTAGNFDTALGTSAATRIINASALANVSSQNNDRIVVELGTTTQSTTNGTIRTGDPSATGDFALTSGLTTDLDPWVEFSAAISAATTNAFFDFFPRIK